jgi:hypothetical protein
MIHIAFLHPVIKCGIIFWIKSTDRKSLSGAKKVVRIMTRNKFRDLCKPLFKALEIFVLE